MVAATAPASDAYPAAPARGYAWARGWRDPRHAQLVILGGLLLYGLLYLGFDVQPWTFPVVAGTAIAVELLGQRLTGRRFDIRSPLISSLSLTIILRADLWVMAVAAAVAIGAKYLIRWDGRHVFNPANLAIIVCVLALGGWIDTGQWGSATLQVFAFAGLAALVLTLSSRLDVALAFLGTYGGLLYVRHVLWLGDPLAIWIKNLSSGALLLFTFFMITDPRTTPDSRALRIAFAVAVGALAYTLQFTLYQSITAYPLWALVMLCPLVPVLNWLSHHPRAPASIRASAP